MVVNLLLFIRYTNTCQSMLENRTILKFADDSDIVSPLDDSDYSHGPVTEHFVRCCESNLQLNISKTENMIVDFRRNSSTPDTTSTKGQTVEYVQSHKYFDGAVCQKGHQCLFCLRKLTSFDIAKTIMALFYWSFIVSVWFFFYGVVVCLEGQEQTNAYCERFREADR